MANEATVIELLGWPPGEPMQVTVADGTAISKGTLMVWADPRTGSASAAASSPSVNNALFCGIAAADKEASDGATRLSVYTNGIFDLTSVSGTVNLPQAGYPVEISGANTVRLLMNRTNPLPSGAEFVSGAAIIVGKALETASASEVIAVRVRT